jgi:DNA-binding NarL/FixJ family response regulator
MTVSEQRAERKAVTVWLVEDNATYRKTVATVINQLPEVRRSNAFSSCEDALAALKIGDGPDVILLDLGLPGLSGLDGIAQFKALSPETAIVILSASDDHQKVFKAICAGASGYLLKASPLAKIKEAIRDVLSGGSPLTPRIARSVLGMFSAFVPAKQDYGLSPREAQVLELIVEGLLMKEVAVRLEVSYHTVDTHLRNIYSKLHVQSRSHAVAKALKERLF